jgi:hypothetical protein
VFTHSGSGQPCSIWYQEKLFAFRRLYRNEQSKSMFVESKVTRINNNNNNNNKRLAYEKLAENGHLDLVHRPKF